MKPNDSHGCSIEEDDLLHRSNKRGRSGKTLPQSGTTKGEHRFPTSQYASFGDTLLRNSGHISEDDLDAQMSADEEGNQETEEDLYCQSIRFNKDVKQRIRQCWKQTNCQTLRSTDCVQDTTITISLLNTTIKLPLCKLERRLANPLELILLLTWFPGSLCPPLCRSKLE